MAAPRKDTVALQIRVQPAVIQALTEEAKSRRVISANVLAALFIEEKLRETTGTVGQRVDLRSSPYGQARYSIKVLDGEYKTPAMKASLAIITYGLLLPFLPLMEDYSGMNISVVDELNGQEVLTITGGGSESGLRRVIAENM